MVTISNWLPLNNVGVASGRGPMVTFGGLICTVQAEGPGYEAKFKRTGAKAGCRCREFVGGRFYCIVLMEV